MSVFSIQQVRSGYRRSLSAAVFSIFALGGAAEAAGPAFDEIRHDAAVAAVEQVMPSVANIATKTLVRNPEQLGQLQNPLFGPPQPDSFINLGSGVIIDEEGYLLTNDHVVQRADQIVVQFNSDSKGFYRASLVARDGKRDIALLKLDTKPGEKFHAIKFAREDDLLLGETVLALGNPYGLGGTVSRGILSSKSRTIPKEGEPLEIPNWLQTDAPINSGNSGGPLVNLRGELIGINVAVLSHAQGIGFAIPIRQVEEALSDILPTEFVRSYWFGARVKMGSNPLAVTSVQPDSPAGKAGLKAGDSILQVGQDVPKSVIHFGELMASHAGSDIPITIRRDEKPQEITVRLVPEASVFNADMIHKKLGLNLKTLSEEELARHYAIHWPGAFAITGIREGSPAARSNLQAGMLIVSVDDESPVDLASFAKRVYAKKGSEPVRLGISAWQQVGDFNALRQGIVELVPR